MALQEVSFYNTNGDEVSLSNIVNQMINYYNMKLEVGETAVTDFNEGSEIRNLLEAFAIGIYALLEEQHEATRIAFIDTSYGQWLDRIGQLPFIDLPRIEGTPAEGSVTFTLAAVQESDFYIPAGTIVNDSNNELDFETTHDVTIIAGEDSVSASVECLTIGVDGNVPAGNIDTVIDSDIDSDLVSVTNPEALIYGSEFEDDDDYRARLLGNVQADGFGTMGYYQSLCEDVTGVHDVKLVDDSTYTKRVLVNGFAKPTPDSVLLEVLSELTLSDNIVLGHSFMVDVPSYDVHDFEISLDVVNLVDDEVLESYIRTFFDGGDYDRYEPDGVSISQSVSRSMIMGALAVCGDVVSVTSIVEDDEEVSTLDPGVGGVLALGDVSFTQNVVG